MVFLHIDGLNFTLNVGVCLWNCVLHNDEISKITLSCSCDHLTIIMRYVPVGSVAKGKLISHITVILQISGSTVAYAKKVLLVHVWLQRELHEIWSGDVT